MAFRALKDTVAVEIAAGEPLTVIYRRHQKSIPISYGQFQKYVAREITGKIGSRGGGVTPKLLSPHKAPVLDQPAAVPLPNPQPALAPEKREQMDGTPIQTRQQPKRFVTRIPDIDRLVYGRKGKPKE